MADLSMIAIGHVDAGLGGGSPSAASSPRLRTMAALAAGAAALCLCLPAAAESRMVVVDKTIVRRTCPSMECGGVGRFNLGESVVSYETEGGWTRVSPYYTAACHGGQSAFVQTGSSACTRRNGIEQGKFAEWVKAEFLKADPYSGLSPPDASCADRCTLLQGVRDSVSD
ncbi:hypothetical protein RB623_05160 [Mesorhizobium sp. LHD-90]|uniref:hypothetical protein n=1 Tax=Mesorhizobium sp. LHD-90 TaxID=3071414 RepID=UPI0027E00B78|nr:hypothetical protein [Mesorhizobium sp. LHD-90]MDQ6433438.1 hypothetical protein [Mesorhizobium sp. LHD-90]